MKKFLLSILCCLLAVVNGYAEEPTATLSFANKAQRTEFSTSKQVWEQDGITFTNNKSQSTSNVADYAKPVRLYASSEILVECSLGNITKIVFDCNSSSYATALKNSIGSTATTSVSSDKVTVTLNGSGNSFTIAKLTAQVRLDVLTVTYEVPSEGDVSKPVAPTLTAGGYFVGSQTVEISCATEGAEIFYTTDGTEPTEDSEAYTESFEITKTTTVKAIAVNEAGTSNVAEATYTRVAVAPEISFNGDGSFESSIEVTISAAEGTEAYYTLNGKTPTDKSDKCPETLILKADATLQVIAYDEEGYASLVAEEKFTLKTSGGAAGAAEGTATLVENVSEIAVGDKVIIVAKDYDYALSTEQRSANRGSVEITKLGDDVELNDKVQVLTIEKGAKTGQFAFQTGSGYLYAASTSANQLKTGTDLNNKASFTIAITEGIATIKADQSDRNWLRFNSTNNPKIFSCYASGQADVSLYKVNLSTIESYELTVSDAGWSTLYLGYNVIIPDGVTCYYISDFKEGTVLLEEVEKILPANTAVIIKAEPGTYELKVTEESSEIESLMNGTVKNKYIDKDAYVLGIVEGEVGLYKAKMNGGVFLNNANKAYLPVSAVSSSAQAANGLKFRFETTGIEGVSAVKGEKVIFDLAGRKLNDMSAPGIYIVNGKKVMVK